MGERLADSGGGQGAARQGDDLSNSQFPDDTLCVAFSYNTIPPPKQNFPDSWRETYFLNLYFQWSWCAPIWHLQLRTGPPGRHSFFPAWCIYSSGVGQALNLAVKIQK